MSDSGTVAAPARQKAVKPLRKEARAGVCVDRKGDGGMFFSASPETPSLFVSAGGGGLISRRGKHEVDDELQRKAGAEEEVQLKCAECEKEEVQRKEEEEVRRKEEEEVQRKEEAAPQEEVQRKCAECEAQEKVQPKAEVGAGAEVAAKAEVGVGAPVGGDGGAAPAAVVHARLTVGAPDDPFEREADKMGEQVRQIPYAGPISAAGINPVGSGASAGSGASTGSGRPSGSGVQRSEEEGVEEVQAKKAPGLQRTAKGGLQTSAGFGSRLQSSGQGNPMAPPVQQHMESAFQADFGAVRIHTGPEAASLSDEIGAQAFTYQNHIYFNENKYNPSSSDGRFLLAHELTHTIQQGAAKTVRRSDDDPPPPDPHQDFFDKLKNATDSVLSRLLPDKIYKIYKAIRDQGFLGYVKSLILGLFQGLFSKLGFSDKEIVEIFTTFAQLKDQLPEILTALSNNDCQPLFAALDKLKTVLGSIAGKVWDRLMDAIEPIRQWLIEIWDTYLSPALDEVKAFAGDVWDMLKSFGSWLWQQFQPVIQEGKDIWAWVSKKLGIGGDPSEPGLLGWVSDKMSAAWTAIKEALKPVTEPIGEVLDWIKSLVNLDAIRKFQEDAQKWLDEVAKSATALGDQDDAIKNKQLTLREVLLPALNKAIDNLKQTVRAAASWVMEKVGGIRDSVNSMVKGVQSNNYISVLYNVVSWVPAIIDKMYDWASDKVNWIFDKIQEGIEYLRQFIDPILKGLEKIVDVVGDLLGKLPDFVTGGLYGKIPKCIKDPIIDWITEKILKNIPVIAELIALKDKWPQIKSAALTVLKQVFVDGKFKDALWTYFRNMLDIIGIDPTLVTTIIAKAATNFSKIISKPVEFLKNVWGVIKGGFKLYWDDIGSNLLQGALDWLFGEVDAPGVASPAKPFTVSGVLGYVLELFGISEENVFQRMAANPRIGQKRAAQLREVWEDVKTAVHWFWVWIKEGPEGLLREAKGKLSGLLDGVISGVTSWVTAKISAKILEKLATSSDPLGIGATINTLIVVYDSIKAGIDYANRILHIINDAMDNLAEIIAGNIGHASEAFRDLLLKAQPVVIGFAVEVIIGKVGDRIREIVADGQKIVNDAIDWLINGAMDIVEGLVGAVKKGVNAVKGWLGLTEEFTADNGEPHTLSFKGSEQHAELMLASDNPMDYGAWIKGIKIPADDKGLAAKKEKALAKAHQIATVQGRATNDKYTPQLKEKELKTLMKELGKLTGPLFKAVRQKTASPTFGPQQAKSEYGTWMEIDGLTKEGLKEGTAPSVNHSLYDAINQRRSGRGSGTGSYYIKGHLLNMHLGGTGGHWQNLTPLTRGANGNHERIAESKVKSVVKSGNIVKYHVTAVYGDQNTDARIKAVDNAKPSSLKGDKATIKAIIRAEAYVPTHILCWATMINPTKNNEETTIVAQNTRINNDLGKAPEDYSL